MGKQVLFEGKEGMKASLRWQHSPEAEAAHATHALLSIDAPSAAEGEQVAGRTCFVIDASGSMGGQPLELAVKALRSALDRLPDDEEVAVVAFGSTAEVVLPACRASQGRARMGDWHPRIMGSTALHAGWHMGATTVASMAGASSSHARVLLLTDGHANIGIVDQVELSRQLGALASQGITTSTMGLGENYDQRMLEVLAEAGQGVFDHVQSPNDIAAALASQLGDTGQMWARDIAIQLPRGMELADQGKLPALLRGRSINVLIKVQLQEAGVEEEAMLLSWTQGDQRHHAQLKPSCQRGPGGQADPKVAEAIEALGFAQAQREAAELAAQGRAAEAERMLSAMQGHYASLGTESGRAFAGQIAASSKLLETNGSAAYSFTLRSQSFNNRRGRIAGEEQSK